MERTNAALAEIVRVLFIEDKIMSSILEREASSLGHEEATKAHVVGVHGTHSVALSVNHVERHGVRRLFRLAEDVLIRASFVHVNSTRTLLRMFP